MDTKFIVWALIGIVVVGGAGFWGGIQYAASKTPVGRGQFAAGNFAGGRATSARAGGNAAFGTIIAKDANSITVQLGGPNATSTNGVASGSKIILYNTNTEVGKTAVGSVSDLSVGQMVTANGTVNSDGSITAQTIQIRPANMQRPQQ
ncbi:MAG: DUF5666 domain-containing protein [bacterium]|nr:DUF5666 domain-containing protein [bacterium]